MAKKTGKLIILSTTFVFLSGVLYIPNFHMLTGTPAFAQSLAGPNIIDHHCTDLSKIPVEWIHAAKANLHIFYQHASHGRQPIEGMKNLDAFMGGTRLYDFSTDGIDRGPDVLDLADGYDHPGTWWYEGVPGADRITDRDDWVILTRAFLDDPENADVNVIMWSWCNIVYYENDSTPIAYDVSLYLERMEMLISEYGPGGTKIVSGERTTPVTFVFMTGHTNFGADGRNRLTFSANKMIRQHCIEHNRILYDFYDIECYNPDGEYFGDGEANRVDYGDYQEGCGGHGIHNLGDNTSYATDSCSVWSNRGNWGVEWQNQHREGVDYFDAYCPHCQEAPVLANLKAYAMWWLMAVLAGWNTETTTSTVNLMDLDNDGVFNSSDNCPSIPNPMQGDTNPPEGNGVGDACDCEGDFLCDGDVDGSDALKFKGDFGRSSFNLPCVSNNPCYGDFNCDGDSDGTDASLFKEDFGRSFFQNPCPACAMDNWCEYPPSSTTTTSIFSTTTTTSISPTTTTTSIPPTTTTTSIPSTTTTTSIPPEICDDSIDNDLDGATDCNDPDCLGLCGNGRCDPCEEDCEGCPEDCAGRRLGKLSERFCCGDGIPQTAEEDGTICDGNY